MATIVCRISTVFAMLLFVLHLSAQSRTTSRAQTSKIIDMSRANDWQVGYTKFNADFSQELKFVAVAHKDRIGSVLTLIRTHKKENKILWSEQYGGEALSAAIPWQSRDRKAEGFLLITRGGAGKRYRVTVVVATQNSARVVLNEIGYGAPYMPEFVNRTKQDMQAIILPDIESYPGTPTQAHVFLWDSKSFRFSKRVVKWTQRFDI
jgi:hypothetical protein